MKFNLLALAALLAFIPMDATQAETVSKFPTIADSVSPSQAVAEVQDDRVMGESNVKETTATAVGTIPVASGEDWTINTRADDAMFALDPAMTVETESISTFDRIIDVEAESISTLDGGMDIEAEPFDEPIAEFEVEEAVAAESLDLFSDAEISAVLEDDVDELFFDAEGAIALEVEPIAPMAKPRKTSAAKEEAAVKGNKGFRIIFGGGYGGFGRRYYPYGSFHRGYYPYRRYGGSGFSIQFGGGHHRGSRRYRGFSGFYPSFGFHRGYYPYNLYRRSYYPSFGRHRLYYPFGGHRFRW